MSAFTFNNELSNQEVPILICSVATISVIIKKIFYPTDYERGRKLLKQNPDKICWDGLSKSPCVEAIALLRQNPDKICWEISKKNLIFENNEDKLISENNENLQ